MTTAESLHISRRPSTRPLTRGRSQRRAHIYSAVSGLSDARLQQLESELAALSNFAETLPPTVERVLQRVRCLADADAIVARMKPQTKTGGDSRLARFPHSNAVTRPV